MGVKEKIFAQILARGAEPTAADMAFAKKLVGGGGGSVTIVPWSTGTDEEIVAMLAAAHAGKIDLQTDGGWAIGDVRTITIGAFTANGTSVSQQDIDIVITSFDEYMSCGNVLQFDFKDALSSGIRMNTSKTNVGGWGASAMKTDVMPALVNALPDWLKNALIEFSCLSGKGGGEAEVETVTGNKLALRSEIEVFGSASHSETGEGSQISYYSSRSNRKKKRGHTGSDNYWWIRSPYKGSATSGCIVDAYGDSKSGGSDSYYGVAPFGCL